MPPKNSTEVSISILEDIAMPMFAPLPLLSSAFWQTVVSAYWPQKDEPNTKSQVHRLPLEGGDSTLMIVDVPATWRPGGRVALLVHGLAGSSHSTYMVRMARRLPKQDVLTIRMNLRNCGAAFGLSRKTYHAGITDDIRSAFKWIAQTYPDSPVTGIGFSLGGNLLLKTATETAGSSTFPLDSLVAISPAADLAGSSAKLTKLPGKIIADSFMRYLLKDLRKLAQQFPELAPIRYTRGMTIRDFDELHATQVHGFKGVDDYYARCSALPHLNRITVPTFIFGSMDDPVVDMSGFIQISLPAHIEVVLTEYGGHVGYIGSASGKNDNWWADDAIMAWMKRRLAAVQTAVLIDRVAL